MGIQINGNTNNINAGIGSLSIEDLNELDIVGVATASNFKTGSSNLHSTGLTVGNALVHSTGINVGTGATVHSPSSNVLTLGTNSIERARIDSSGNLLIGTTTHYGSTNTQVTIGNNSTTNSGLTIAASASNGYSRIHFANGTSSSAQYAGWVTYSHADEALLFGVNESGGDKVRIQSDGSLKLLDDSKIHLGGAQNGAGDLQLYHNGSNSFIQHIGTGGLYIDALNNSADIAFRSQDNINFYTNAASQSSIACVGNGGVVLYNQGNARFNTDGDGAVVTEKRFAINRNAGDPYLQFQTSGTTHATLYGGSSTGFRVFTGGTQTERVRITTDGHTLFSGLTTKNDPRNAKGITVKSTDGVSFQNYGSNGSRNWRIRPDDQSRWGDLDFSVSPTANSATDWPDAASDKVLTLGHDGTVLKPRNPCFQAVVNGSHVSAGSYVVFGSVDVNKGGHYNSSNGIFTAPVDGVYLFHISSIAFNNATTVFRFFLKINNGNTGSGNDAHLRIDMNNDDNDYAPNASYTYYKNMNANDTARVYFAPDDNNAQAYGGSDYFKFGGHLVG